MRPSTSHRSAPLSFLLTALLATTGCAVDGASAPPEPLGSVTSKGEKADQFGIQSWELAYDHATHDIVVSGVDGSGEIQAEARLRASAVETEAGPQRGVELSLEYPETGRALLAEDGTVLEDSLSTTETGRSLLDALSRDFAEGSDGKFDVDAECFNYSGLSIGLCAAAVALCLAPGGNILACGGGAGTCALYAYGAWEICTE